MNVDNYTVDELLNILHITDKKQINEMVINSLLDTYVSQFEEKNNEKMVIFFEDMRSVLLEYLNEESERNAKFLEKETKDWYEEEYLSQAKSQPNQAKKVTTRNRQTEIYSNEHVPMKREQLGVNNSFTVPVAQDTLNPNLENTITRFVTLDSQYRQSNTSSTDYTINLSDHLTDVLSIRLYSFQVPCAWYTIDRSENNAYLWIIFQDNEGNEIIFENDKAGIPIIVPDGSYNVTSFVIAMKNAFLSAGFTFPLSAQEPPQQPVTYNAQTGLITLHLYNAIYTAADGIVYYVTGSTIIQFFDTNGNFHPISNPADTTAFCKNHPSFNINTTLGFLMGFRVLAEYAKEAGNTASVLLNLMGTKYIIVSVDDFNQNHINNDIVGISQNSSTMKLPSYYTPDMSKCNVTKYDKTIYSSFEKQIQVEQDNITPNIPYVENNNPAKPLTQAQLYSINEIMRNNALALNSSTTYTASPVISDTLALIPVKTILNLGEIYSDFSGALQDNKRTYFGPVDIERLKIQLYNDKGQLLNLHGSDWSMCLMCECLYQY